MSPRFAGLLLVLAARSAMSQVADVPQDLREALQHEVRQRADAEACIGLDFPQPAPWRGHPAHGSAPLAYGVEPLDHVYAPGQFALLIASDGASDAYLRLRSRMELLTKLGYFTAEANTYVYPATEPVRIKSQTMGATQGFTERVIPIGELRRPQPAIRYVLTREGWIATRGKPCLPVGKTELLEIETLKRSEASGHEVAVLRYKVGIRPEGVTVDPVSMVRAFGERWMQYLAPRTVTTTFVRTPKGWLSDPRMRALLNRSSIGEPKSDAELVPLDAKALQDAIELYVAASQGRSRACIRLPSGSHVHETGVFWRSAERSLYSASFYDFPDAHPERGTAVGRGLALVRDLEKAGVMSVRPATPLIMHQPDELGGARFDLLPELHRYLSAPTNPCLVYAELEFKLEWISNATSTGDGRRAEFIAVATPRRLEEWVVKAGADKALPSIRLALAGMGVKGAVSSTNQAWRVERLEVLEPQYGVPADWKALFAALPRGAEYRKANAAKKTPEIQAIVVQSAGTAAVTVNDTGRPVILHLSSSLPTEWRLKVAPGARLTRVVASTSSQATVRGAPEGVKVDVYSAEDARRRASNDHVLPLRPPRQRYFGGGRYEETVPTIGAEALASNLEAVETLLGGEFTAVQTELGPKNFTIPRRWVQPK